MKTKKLQSRNKLSLSKTAIARLSLTRAQLQGINGGVYFALAETSAKTSKVVEEEDPRNFCTSVTHGYVRPGI